MTTCCKVRWITVFKCVLNFNNSSQSRWHFSWALELPGVDSCAICVERRHYTLYIEAKISKKHGVFDGEASFDKFIVKNPTNHSCNCHKVQGTSEALPHFPKPQLKSYNSTWLSLVFQTRWVFLPAFPHFRSSSHASIHSAEQPIRVISPRWWALLLLQHAQLAEKLQTRAKRCQMYRTHSKNWGHRCSPTAGQWPVAGGRPGVSGCL